MMEFAVKPDRPAVPISSPLGAGDHVARFKKALAAVTG